MMKNVHGGDLDYVVRRYGLKREDIRDFSGNINPLGLPESAKKAIAANIDRASTYPDKNYLALRTAIARYINADTKDIIVGNGGTELISLFIRALETANAVIVAPVYSEYEREIKLCGGKCEYYALKEENAFAADASDICRHISANTELLALCNPNNPTGTALTRREMEIIIQDCASKNVNVLIDETYCEFADESVYSSVPLVEKYSNTIVIRGVSKFFAAPGLRLGYAVCGSDIRRKMDRIRDPWSVNTLAAVAAVEFFSDTGYISKTKEFFKRERERISAELSEIKGVRPYETVTNFQLFKLLAGEITSEEIFERLIVKSMMVRDAKSFKFLDETFIRFCFLNRQDNDILLSELKKIIQ